MTTAPNKPPVLSQLPPEMVVQPDDNKSSTAKEAAGALTTVSSAVDPMPHYGLAGLSLGGAYYYSQVKTPKMTGTAGLLGLAAAGYGYAGYLLSTTDREKQVGYRTAF